MAKSKVPPANLDHDDGAPNDPNMLDADAIIAAHIASQEVGEARAATHTEPAKAHSNLRFVRTKSVAVPLFKLVADEPRFFLCEGAMFTGKQIDDKKEAATLMPVTDLETGEMGQIIVGKVLAELLVEQYTDATYVGKRFELTLRKKADKKYNTYDLFEVADSEG